MEMSKQQYEKLINKPVYCFIICDCEVVYYLHLEVSSFNIIFYSCYIGQPSPQKKTKNKPMLKNANIILEAVVCCLTSQQLTALFTILLLRLHYWFMWLAYKVYWQKKKKHFTTQIVKRKHRMAFFLPNARMKNVNSKLQQIILIQLWTLHCWSTTAIALETVKYRIETPNADFF